MAVKRHWLISFMGNLRDQKPESRGRCGESFGFTKLGAGCSKFGLDNPVPGR
jgi:hypothetical protein